MKRKGYDEGSFFDLVRDGAVRETKVTRLVTAKGEEWALYFRLGGLASPWHTIRSQREAVRTWARLDTLAKFAKNAGVPAFVVEP
ncbi:hypothetical protein HDC30_005756 [Pseudomonas sp. JAI115]|uniref:hypothetical protein n=1 Tax=Pseudomonas sp. JAI115 TaxID=2723061 RepID=UPI00161593F6|nr:hypothetical protein [Pseudomonas sp. JAI115]MBB6158498.1 hypothetical protein [Pseudomonas sp. JAI115]